jgi:hypothetical protein
VFSCLSKRVLNKFIFVKLPRYSRLSTRVWEKESELIKVKIAATKMLVDKKELADFILRSFKNYSFTFVQNPLAIIRFIETINHFTF